MSKGWTREEVETAKSRSLGEFFAERLLNKERRIDNGLCPRCGQPLDDDDRCQASGEPADELLEKGLRWGVWAWPGQCPDAPWDCYGHIEGLGREATPWCGEHGRRMELHPHGGHRCPACEEAAAARSQRFMQKLTEETTNDD
jgi:tRNA(Ile2) C34 agmatinyltransferase TiaS